ncbi:hypothetical protein [Streptomyces sp. NPDC059874]
MEVRAAQSLFRAVVEGGVRGAGEPFGVLGEAGGEGVGGVRRSGLDRFDG